MKKEYLINKLGELNSQTSGEIYEKINEISEQYFGKKIANFEPGSFIIDINKIIEIIKPEGLKKIQVEDISF